MIVIRKKANAVKRELIHDNLCFDNVGDVWRLVRITDGKALHECSSREALCSYTHGYTGRRP